MFYLTYLCRELTRRRGRTLLTVLGLAVGVGLVVTVASITDGIDQAQERVLNPLSSVGTDLTVTRSVSTTQTSGQQPQQTPNATPQQQADGSGEGFVFGGHGGGQAVSPQEQQQLLAENLSVLTDLSKLGKPGDKFVHTFFLPATQLTFPASEMQAIKDLPGVTAVSGGLTLLAQRQEGTVPAIVAEIQTGGETLNITQAIAPPTAEEEAQIQACIAQAGTNNGVPTGENENGENGEAPHQFDGGAFGNCFPARFQQYEETVEVPQRIIRQALNPPQTDITTDPFTIAGVDPATPGIGLITPAQVAQGKFFSREAGGSKEAVLSDAYAQRKGLSVGSTIDLNGTVFQVVGLANPPLGGMASDVYLALVDLQQLAGRVDRLNVLLVRATDVSSVDELTTAMAAAFPGSQVTSAQELAGQINGSLVDASTVANRLGLVLAIVVMAAAVLIASLLTLSSVAKRVREFGTLKALGWRQGLVVRQVVGEALVQGALGGLLGAVLGVAAAKATAAFVPALSASAVPASQPSGTFFGLGNVVTAATQSVPLEAPIGVTLLLLAVGLALAGGLIAGGVGAFRAARLRPAEALRDLG